MRFDIRLKYTLCIVTLILFLTAISIGYTCRQMNRISRSFIDSSSQVMEQALLQGMERRGVVISQILSANLINPIYSYDQNAIEHLVEAYKSYHNVLRIDVFDAEGKVIHDGTREGLQYGVAANNNSGVQQVLAQHKPVIQTQGDRMNIYHPVMLDSISLGGVRVEMSLSEIRDQIGKMHALLTGIQLAERRRAYQQLIGFSAGIIILGIVLAYMLASRISIPIRKLSRYAANVGRGDYSDRLDYKAKDELGELSDAFAAMQNDLMHSTVSIGELEKQVILRTRELAEANQELTQHQEQLELKIAERTAELVEANTCLSQEIEHRKRIQEKLIRAKKMEAIGTLAAGVAHDLNNILTGMVGIPDLVLMNLPGDSALRNELLTIKKSGLRAAAVVQDLLNLARKNIVRNEPMEFRSMLAEYLNSPEHRDILKNHPGVIIHTEIQEGEFIVLGSRVHLLKTLTNLVSNAAESMPNGGPLTISLSMRSIDPSTLGYKEFIPGKYIVVQVKDAGEGMPPDTVEHIFEPFYTTKAMGRSGSGLGLAVVWETMKDHKGHIDVQSSVGEGTVFTLYFPEAHGVSLTQTKETALDDYRGRGETVLIVDDQENQRNLLKNIMTRLGYHAHALAGGEEAVEYLKIHSADVLILDMVMTPGMDGVDSYREILKIRPKQKAIMVSGYSEAARANELQNLGVSSYVRKPYTIKQIGRAVRAEMDRRPQAADSAERAIS